MGEPTVQQATTGFGVAPQPIAPPAQTLAQQDTPVAGVIAARSTSVTATLQPDAQLGGMDAGGIPQAVWADPAAHPVATTATPAFLLPSSTTSTSTDTSTVGTTSTTTATTTLPPGPAPLLFCWSHMQPKTAEETLIRQQLVKRASIFACNGFAVISTERILIGNISGAGVYTWMNPAEDVGMGKYVSMGRRRTPS